MKQTVWFVQMIVVINAIQVIIYMKIKVAKYNVMKLKDNIMLVLTEFYIVKVINEK